MHKEIVELLNNKVSGCDATFNEAEVGDSSITVNSKNIKDVCLTLKSCDMDFNVLQVISGVDYEDRIELNYILASFTNNHEVIIKTKLSKTGSDTLVNIESICDVWKAADFLERENFDMLGVNFEGHPDMRRILCPEDWEGYPLRKDYVVQETYQGLEVNPKHKVNQDDFDFLTKLKLEADNPKLISGSWKGSVSPELEQALARKLETLKSE